MSSYLATSFYVAKPRILISAGTISKNSGIAPAFDFKVRDNGSPSGSEKISDGITKSNRLNTITITSSSVPITPGGRF